jgi:hypothetical protein
MPRGLRRHLSYANVMSTLAAFFALAGGAAYAANTVFSSDIVDNQVYPVDVRNENLSGGGLGGVDIANDAVTTVDIRDDNLGFGGLFAQDLAAGSVRGSEVQDGSLKDEDVAKRALASRTVGIGTVSAHSCVFRLIPDVEAEGDHILLTPKFDTSTVQLSYSAEYLSSTSSTLPVIKACNHSGFDFDDANSVFNVLVIEAQ